jgi:hypothetical protein
MPSSSGLCGPHKFSKQLGWAAGRAVEVLSVHAVQQLQLAPERSLEVVFIAAQ